MSRQRTPGKNGALNKVVERKRLSPCTTAGKKNANKYGSGRPHMARSTHMCKKSMSKGQYALFHACIRFDLQGSNRNNCLLQRRNLKRRAPPSCKYMLALMQTKKRSSAFCRSLKIAWMSQQASKWLVSGGL